MTTATLAASLQSTGSAASRGHGRGWALAGRLTGTWLMLAAALAVVLPAAGRLFGQQRAEQPVARARADAKLDDVGHAAILRLEHTREDLLLIGATSSLTGYLRSREERAGEVEATLTDLRQFVATRDWCLGIGLAPPGGAAVVAERGGRSLGCDPLFAIVAGLTPGTLVLDRADVAGAPRLCVGLSLEAAAGSAALVAEADPAVLFPELAPAAADEAPLFLADGHGRWLVGPPPDAPLVRTPLALSSWQGPAGGRWELSRTAIPMAVPGPVSSLSRGESAAATGIVAALMVLALTSALEARRRLARLGVSTSGDHETEVKTWRH
jgi:hypothetical protein